MFHAGEQFRPHLRCFDGDDDQQQNNRLPEQFSEAQTPFLHGAFGLQHEGVRSVRREGHQRKHRDRHGEPVQDADLTVRAEISEERHGKLAGSIQRHAAHDVAQRRADQDGEQNVGADKGKIPARAPERIFDVPPNSMEIPRPDQAPQQKKQRQIKSPRTTRQGLLGNATNSGSTKAHEPDLVPAPQRPDGGDHHAAFRLGFADERLQHARAQVHAVQHDETSRA